MRSHSLKICRSSTRKCWSKPIGCQIAGSGIRWLSSGGGRPWSTPLAKSLAEAITTTGPISVASYMRQCLTSPEGGYYTRQTSGHDQFGAKGDFITSPEISQVFGELVGIWLYTEWLAQGRKGKVQIIEVGPGRGTLMGDVLRTISNFKPFAESIEAIYLVEASPHLRAQQAKLLATSFELQEIETGWNAACKYLPDRNITWCEDIRFVPNDPTTTPFILAHEFFDALPIHVFQNTPSSNIPAASTILTPTGPITPKHGSQLPKNQWHELVVSPTPQPPPSTIATSSSISHKGPQETPEFQLTVSKTPTPHSIYLPQTSPRYTALKSTPNAIIEISPESLSYVSDFAIRIGGPDPSSSTSTSPSSTPSAPSSPSPKPTPSGAALILDYGPIATIPANTLRGIRSHQPCSPFLSPGLVDLSADVDFLALAESAINASPGVDVHGPVEQAFFLSTLGIAERAGRLVEAARVRKGDGNGGESGEEVAKRVEGGWKRLIDRGPTGMGRLYKAMAIVPHVGGRGEVRRPVGFGGHVVG
ncbi:S-adenosyl-L-methionine-dependent methyltransferase [Clohesyomyces aquaticus]|uniref:Protein arginine methyltransferase NDUFAF7 n=1 Tax=Clohesyomyces aquaticus TaxID=1231657 RepID=A0A1Y1ZX29_9PLEO|nr:S-adenosyl-L-methionine-dependent methyltransferase [Clohesyomyces aquaticus]